MPRTAIRYFTPAGRSKGGFVRLTSGVAATAFVLNAFRTRCVGFACICSTAVVVDAIAMATCGSQASVPGRPFHSRRSTLSSRSLSKISIGRVKSGRPSSQPHHNALSPLAGVRGVDQSESTSCHEPYFSTNEDGTYQAGFDHVRFPHAPTSSPRSYAGRLSRTRTPEGCSKRVEGLGCFSFPPSFRPFDSPTGRCLRGDPRGSTWTVVNERVHDHVHVCASHRHNVTACAPRHHVARPVGAAWRRWMRTRGRWKMRKIP